MDFRDVLQDPGSMVPLTLLRAREVLMEDIRPILQQYGLTEVQWRVMRVLYIEDSIDFGELSDVTLIQRASLSRVIPTMVDKGLARREVNEHDNRLVTISSTEKMVELVDHVMPRVAKVYRLVAEKVGDPGFERFREALEQFIEQGSGE